MTRALLFIFVVGLIIAIAIWLISAKARRAAAFINHKHELDEIKTDKKVAEYEKIENKARK